MIRAVPTKPRTSGRVRVYLERSVVVDDGTVNGGNLVADCPQPADAAFIVQAWNSQDDLVAVAREVVDAHQGSKYPPQYALTARKVMQKVRP